MQARVVVAQVVDLQILNGLDDGGGNQVDFLFDAGQRLERVEQQRRGSAQQIAGFAGDDATVGHFHGGGGLPRLFRHFQRGRHHSAVFARDMRLVHDQFGVAHFFFAAHAHAQRAARGVIAPHNLHARGLLANFVVGKAKARHVYAHIRGRAIGGFAVNRLENRL